jgi:hypothetical protein
MSGVTIHKPNNELRMIFKARVHKEHETVDLLILTSLDKLIFKLKL